MASSRRGRPGDAGQTPPSAAGPVITFAVPGMLDQPGMRRGPGLADGAEASGLLSTQGLQRLQRVLVSGARRDAATVHPVQAQVGRDLVRLLLDDGAELRLNPQSAKELFEGLAQRAGLRDAAATPAGEVPVPAELCWDGEDDSGDTADTTGATRAGGLWRRVRLKAVEVLTGQLLDVPAGAAQQAVAQRLVRLIDDRVDPGVYALKDQAALKRLKDGGGQRLSSLPKPEDGRPVLVLLHGTFVDTAATFQHLWGQWPAQLRALFERYGGTLYALEHRTVGVDPFTNALPLAQALEPGTVLHLLTHSRGGLVAEVLARLAATERLDELQFTRCGPEMAGFWPAAQQLHTLLREKKITVQRVVRVACPARGTLLAAGRLDVYLSGLAWLLGKAGLPVAPELVDFLNGVAQHRTDPRLMPGLQVMLPGSGLVQWLNDGTQAVPGQLRVVAGDLQADSVGGFFKTLLADAYYWRDNDIVVHTASMYGGSRRAGTGSEASYLLHRKGTATHFAYFRQLDTVDAITDALLKDPQPAQFQAIGPLSWQGQSSEGYRELSLPDPDKPAVFVLPGIMGSNLKRGDRRIWLGLGLLGGLDGLAYQAGAADGIVPDGALSMYFGDLQRHLQRSHEVHEFAFDWRRPIEESARLLADQVDQALAARRKTGQPVQVVAHSMGGLVVRTMALERPKTWDALMAHPQARLLMLGVPNAGSYAPMQVLSGDDGFGNFITAVGAPLGGAKARRLIAGMPGLLSLQAGLTDPALKLDQEATWQQLADADLAFVRQKNWWNTSVFPSGDGERPAEAEFEWGVPPQAVLDQAKALRQRLDEQARTALPKLAAKIKLVVGQGGPTAQAFEASDTQGFSYLQAADGDGRVTLASAQLPGVDTWRAPGVGHADLARWGEGFDAYVELLVQGHTDRLAAVPAPAARRGANVAPSAADGDDVAPPRRFRLARGRRPVQPPRMDLPNLDANADSPPRPARGREPPPPLKVQVRNGNLSFIDVPLFLGHYQSLELTGTERVVNSRIGGTMQAALDLQAGHYPDQLGMHQAFLNVAPGRAAGDAGKPPAAVVVGLGQEGMLSERQLSRSMRLAVLDWLQRQRERPERATDPASAPPLQVAAVLMGSGGVGVDPMVSARAIVQAVVQANARASAVGWAPVAELTLVELYHDRATDAWRALREASQQAGDGAAPFQLQPLIATGHGAKRRPLDSSYRGADYDLVRITARGQGVVEYALDSRRARSEVRVQSTQAKLVHQLVREAARAGHHDPQLSRALFRLLVPPALEPHLLGQGRLLLDMSDAVAAIPWEMLDPGRSPGADTPEAEPWAVRCGLVRRLQTLSEPGAGRHDSLHEDGVLVVGDPLLTQAGFAQLPQAQREAQAVAQAFGRYFGRDAAARSLHTLVNAQAYDIITALQSRDWRVVHIAGHGHWPQASASAADRGGAPGDAEAPAYGGVVLSGDSVYLGPNEIGAMRAVPALVFINCCHLGTLGDGGAGSQAMAEMGYGQFAAGVAQALIRIGVRCVVAAGWAVEDEAARCFAESFYQALLQGKPFGEAVTAARRDTHALERRRAAGGAPSNTWAAYQCYGDPGWRLLSRDDRGLGDAAQGPERFDAQKTAQRYRMIASAPALVVALESLAVDALSNQRGADKLREQQRAQADAAWLLEQFGPQMLHIGAVADAFSVVFEACGNFERALELLRLAVKAADGTAPMKAYERLGNLSSRLAYETLRELRWRHSQSPDDPVLTQQLGDATELARRDCGDAIALLTQHAGTRHNEEALALIGSAHKRLAMVLSLLGQADEAAAQVALARQAYQKALDSARASGGSLKYSAQNLLGLAAREAWMRAAATAGGSARRVDTALAAQCTEFRQILQADAASRAHDVWQHLGDIELRLVEALAQGLDEPGFAQARKDFADLHERFRGASAWRTTLDQWEFVLGPPALLPAGAVGARQLLESLRQLASGEAG